MKRPGDRIRNSLGGGLLILVLLAMIAHRVALSLLANLDAVDRTAQALKTVNALLASLEVASAGDGQAGNLGSGGGTVVLVHRYLEDLRRWAAGNPERKAWLNDIEARTTLADLQRLAAKIALEHQKARKAGRDMIVAVVGFGALAVIALALLAGGSLSADREKGRIRDAQREIRRVSGWLLHAEDRERRRIARELHDTTGQNLAALEIDLSVVNASASSLEPKAREALSEATALARVCSREIRSLSFLLHPAGLEEGLAAALHAAAEGYAHRAGFEVQLGIPPELGRMPLEVEIALLHFVQECLLNIHQHTRSRTAKVHLEVTATEVLAVVSDQGRSGIPPKGEVKLGVGIASMQERARELGGRVEIEPGDRGTTLKMILPLQGGSA